MEAERSIPVLACRANTLRYEDGRVVILNRRKLPWETEYVTCSTYEEVARAIESMIIQGAPPLAYAAGYGLALAARSVRGSSPERVLEALKQAAKRMACTRPTGSDLWYVLQDVLDLAEKAVRGGEDVEASIVEYVSRQMRKGDEVAEACGRNAADLLADGDKVLTHCFAGAALIWMLIHALRQGKHIELFATETRPYLQGARLTASSAVQIGVPVTLVTDGMPGYLMYRRMVTKFVTTADVITLDGHIANKVGTFQYAMVAHHLGIPYFVLGYGGPDPRAKGVEDITIEERDPQEVLECLGKRTTVEGVRAYYPAFDITPPAYISAIITDRGVFPATLIHKYLDHESTLH
ncbi:MAG: s-methyl-5-thioribose-1-phosphate isomerase [Bacillota bacterium]